MTSQTVIDALLGGALIGLGAAVMLLWNGKIAGVSGIVKGLVHIQAGDWQWRLAFVAGLVLGGVGWFAADPAAFHIVSTRPAWVVAVAGVLVGYGTVMDNGCTSGHGVCGVSRLSPRSIVATLTFIGVGMVTAVLFSHWVR